MLEGKRLVVKDWFHEKKMNELKKDVQSTNVFAILKETEKALQVFVGDPCLFMTYWCPKSCIEERPEVEKSGVINNITFICDSFEEAFERWNFEMSFYR